MKAFGKRMRGSLAAALSTALIMSGALLAAPAAYAEESESAPVVVSTETVETPAAVEQPGETPAEEPADGVPAEDTALAEEGEESTGTGDAESNEAAAPVTQTPKVQSRSLSLLAVGPQIVVNVTEVLDAKITIGVEGSGFDDVKALPGQSEPHVYLGLIEKDSDLASVDTDSVPNVSATINADGTFGDFNAAFEAAASSLDKTKSYEVIAWPSRSAPTSANLYTRADAVIDWSALFSPPVSPQLVASVTDVSEAGLTVSVQLDNVKIPVGKWGAYLGVIEKDRVSAYGLDAGAGMLEKYLTTASFTDGSALIELDVPAVKKDKDGKVVRTLDRSKEYVVVSWLAHGFLTDEVFLAQQSLAVTDVQWSKIFPGPYITAEVAEAAGTGIKVSVKGIGFDDVRAHPGQTSPHVYVTLVETGSLETSESGSISADVADGVISGVLEIPASQLDRSKQYEVITWPSRSKPSEANIYTRAQVTIDWNALFPAPPATGKASITSANTSGFTVTGSFSGVDANSLSNGVHVGVVVRGTASGSTSADFLGSTSSISAIPESGEFGASVVVPASQLDRSKQYELVVWPRRTNPTTSNIVLILPFDVSTGQWNAIFPAPVSNTPGAGSLTWGVSTEFADYINGTIAKGSVTTSGVGGGRGGYVFPQASSSNWNSDTRTGTVSYRGSVNYYGHSGAINMTFANPVITVSSPISGSLSINGQTFPLNLGAGSFAANSDGSVTWSNVPVNGAISGGDGGGAGGTVGMDNLTFTVGSVSSANYGSTVTTSPAAQTRPAAPTPPATTGLSVVTSPLKIVAGGEIEITASGFQPNESGILVVIYSDPTVLDTKAKADANGVVRWIGKLPEGLIGKHTLTLQGSINVGQEIEIAQTEVETRAATISSVAEGTEEAALISAPADGTPAWIWWTSAIALLVIAGAATGLVVAQRKRNAETPTHL